VREQELWRRLTKALGSAYVMTWSEQVVIAQLNDRTVTEALAANVPCKTIWRAVWEVLELPADLK
jgi:hypothetical protein